MKLVLASIGGALFEFLLAAVVIAEYVPAFT
jgi:hypothetical protein